MRLNGSWLCGKEVVEALAERLAPRSVCPVRLTRAEKGPIYLHNTRIDRFRRLHGHRFIALIQSHQREFRFNLGLPIRDISISEQVKGRHEIGSYGKPSRHLGRLNHGSEPQGESM